MRRLLTLPLALVLLAVALTAAPFGVDARSPRAPLGHELTAAYTFDMYCEDHGKSYTPASAEYNARKANFDANLQEILAHNSNTKRSYTKGVGRHTDWSMAEFKSILGARREPKHVVNPLIEKPYLGTSDVPIASSLDYRQNFPPVLTAVKDQGRCGDCWAHAVTEAIESAYAVKTGELLVLSQQQITSCTPKQGGCYGCQGMYPKFAYEYAASSAYVMEEWVYPFESYEGNNVACLNMTNPVYPLQNFVSLAGYMQISPNRQDIIVAALNELGPLSILVNALPFLNYEGGVFDGCVYNANFYLDHAVLLVGYGYDSDAGLDYWIVRNSWSAEWGEHGYIRLLKTVLPACGLDMGGMSCFAAGNTTQPEPTCGMCGLLVDAQFPMVI